MKTCLICPIPNLRDYVTEHNTHHLLLSHLMDDLSYVEFYLDRALYGAYLIIDNGAKENGTGLGLSQLLEDAARVMASEVVLTDVRYKCPETIATGKHELEWLKSTAGRKAYEKAGHPKLMIVPQGVTVVQWLSCLFHLIEYVDIAREDIPELPEPTIGFAYHYDHMFEGGLLGLIEAAETNGFDLHLLGWPRKMSTLRDVAIAYPQIRSVDSGRPFSYAIEGLAVMAQQVHVKRRPNFFTEPIPEERQSLVWANIDTFRHFAGASLKEIDA